MNNYPAVGIEELNLNTYTYNALKRAGISTLSELKTMMHEGSLTKIRYIGEEAEKEIVEQIKSFMKDAEENPLRTSHKMNADVINKNNLSPFDIVDDLSVNILEDYLGKQTVNNLINAKIYTLGDLHDLVSAYLSVVNSEESILNHVNEGLASAVKALILNNGLHINAMIDGKKLYNIIYQVPESTEEKLSKFDLMKKVLKSKSLTEDLELIFKDLTNREKDIFIRHTIDKVSYRELGRFHGISGERVRQIYDNSVEILSNQIEDKPNLFLQSVFLIADELGDELNPAKFEYQLKELGMLDSKIKFQNQAILKMCMALMINKDTSILIDPLFNS